MTTRAGTGPAPSAESDEAMVVAADRLAADAGDAILRAGGSAADAVVAAGAVMAVTNPHTGDLGGDLFALVYRPGPPEPEVVALCAAGRAGSGADPLQMRCEDLTRVPPRGDIRAVTVPGCVDGWVALHERYGRLPLAHVLEPAVTYAAGGFPASPLLAARSREVVDLPGAHDLGDPTRAHGGRLPVGTMLRRPSVANTLSAVADSGRNAFYLGAFGDGLRELGLGLFRRGDLARNQAVWAEPVAADAWGHRLWGPPPPSQAYLTLSGAAIADRLPLPDDPDDAAWAHLTAEAARQAAWDRPRVLFDGADGAALLAPGLRAGRAAAVDPARAGSAPVSSVGGDTTALAAVDRDGTAVSLVQSNAQGWGAHIVEPTTTVFLHNRGIGFSLEPGHPAELRPDVRPPHTLSPALVTDTDGRLRAVLGTMGGDAQPQVLLQLLHRLLRLGAAPGAALDAARWIWGDGGFTTWDADGPAHLHLEPHAPVGWRPGLEARGHAVVTADDASSAGFGHSQVIVVEGERLAGAADPRSMAGAAVGPR